jgi:hypothetical protein
MFRKEIGHGQRQQFPEERQEEQEAEAGKGEARRRQVIIGRCRQG